MFYKHKYILELDNNTAEKFKNLNKFRPKFNGSPILYWSQESHRVHTNSSQRKTSQMDDAKKFLKEKLDLTTDHIIAYLKSHWPRVAICAIVFVLQFFWVFWDIKASNWKTRGLIYKICFFLTLFIPLVVFEILRWADFFVHKYYCKHKRTRDSGQSRQTGAKWPVRSAKTQN
jgi:hypothetical protein